ncbi:MAG: DNA mismatch repair protein MutS [Deltaproteobacteria bacterium]|nr:DNA mismatch repair protein MutS [Deltaproteobacteria bacterium]
MTNESSFENATPMLKQYALIKAEHPDSILMYRLGDFYEMFFDDAVESSKILGITLTTRNRNDPNPVPLCGVPFHAVEPYIAKLVDAGKRVAICDQVEDPATAKGVVKREVTRLVTPGVILDATTLDAKRDNFLAAVEVKDDGYDLAVVDISTGRHEAGGCSSWGLLIEELTRCEPREILIPTSIPEGHRQELAIRFPAMLQTSWSDGVMAYLEQTQRGSIRHLQEVRPLGGGRTMRLDEVTKRNLELVTTLQGEERTGSLLGLLDRTKTAMGGRLLRSWILSPLLRHEEIAGRLDAVEALMGTPATLATLTESLAAVYDLERIASRVAMGTANARDCVALARSLEPVPAMKALLLDLRIQNAGLRIQDCGEDIRERITRTLVDDPPIGLRDGGIIRDGLSPELDELRKIAHHGKDVIAGIEAKEREATGISSLKVRFNKVFGYFLEVTHTHRDKVPHHYIRKQTLVGAERYITPELKEYEEKVLGAEEKMLALEYRLFCELRDEIATCVRRLQQTARVLAELDALASLAVIARDSGYVRPEVVDDMTLEIVEGRHPIVERMPMQERFVPNDVMIGDAEGRLMMITGPNMAGKSTVMRQVALICLMAQIGSYVPARRARIGLVDRIFTRIGAADALARGQSTFMVEMTEAAVILREATRRSLVIIDEIGRGTSTFDGLAIAWAVAEDLATRVKARTLFATHYHELTELADTLPAVHNFHIAVREEKGEIIFLRRLLPGSTPHSFGIHVAKLAGLPADVISRANHVLKELERGKPL